MTAITYTHGRGWHPVRDTGNPTRDPLATPATTNRFNALGWLRYHAVRGRPLSTLVQREMDLRVVSDYRAMLRAAA